MTARTDATLASAHMPRGLPPRPVHLHVFDRVAAQLKALGRPFPRALDLGSGRGELAGHVLREVPGLRLVALDFSEAAPEQSRQRLGNKVGRFTFVTRKFTEPAWAGNLGRFDAVISHDAVHALLPQRRAAALYAQVRTLLLPGGFFLLSDRDADGNGASPYLSLDEQCAALEEAGWSSVQPLRQDRGHLLLKAHP